MKEEKAKEEEKKEVEVVVAPEEVEDYNEEFEGNESMPVEKKSPEEPTP